MSNKFSFCSALRSFIASTLLSSALFFAAKNYIEFLELTSGSYNIAVLFDMPLRDFLLILLLTVAGILAFVTYAIKVKKFAGKRLYTLSFTIMGLLWIALPHISIYTISRFTGLLILQTVSGIAIISNVVFMMISICCGFTAIVDILGDALQGNGNAPVLIAGIPTGFGLTLTLGALLSSTLGLDGVMTVLGVLLLAFGIAVAAFGKKNSAKA